MRRQAGALYKRQIQALASLQKRRARAVSSLGSGRTRPSRRSYAKKALVYNGPGQKEVEDRPKPEIAEPTDAIVKIVKTTICGTDLHILKGDVPTCTPGRILGHEGIGVVDKVGAAVTTFRAGDRVIVSCISSCGKCDYCRRGMYSHCAGILAHFHLVAYSAKQSDNVPIWSPSSRMASSIWL